MPALVVHVTFILSGTFALMTIQLPLLPVKRLMRLLMGQPVQPSLLGNLSTFRVPHRYLVREVRRCIEPGRSHGGTEPVSTLSR